MSYSHTHSANEKFPTTQPPQTLGGTVHKTADS